MCIEIRKYGDPVLRDICQSVEKIELEEKNTFYYMKEILLTQDALGIAAPQIGMSQRMIAVKVDGDLIQLANPTITDGWGKKTLTEGCLSLPEVFVKVPRSRRVLVEGVDEKGRRREFEAEGMLARVIQHEVDHLNGTLIVDYATPRKKDKLRDKLNELAEHTKMILRVKNR